MKKNQDMIESELSSPGHQETIRAAEEIMKANRPNDVEPMAAEPHYEPCCVYEPGISIGGYCPCRCHLPCLD